MSQVMDIKQHILELEEKRVQAFLDADLDVLGSILADDLTFIHTSTNVDSKSSFMQRLETGALAYQLIVTEDVQVRVYGEAAVVTGKIVDMKNTVRGTQRRYGCVFSGVYVRQNRGWQMVAMHATRIPEADTPVQ